jgi:hypothetical protein
LKIVDSKFKASQDNSTDPVWVIIRFRLDIGNRGAQTTLRVQEIDVTGVPLDESSLNGFFNEAGQRLSLESGFSGMVRCSIKGKTTKTMPEIPSEISGQIVLRETFAGNLQPLAFTAQKEE